MSSLITVPRSLPTEPVTAPRSAQSSSLTRTDRCLVFGSFGMHSRYAGVRTPATCRKRCGVRTPRGMLVYVHLGLGAQRTIRHKELQHVSKHDLPPGDWRLRVYGRGPSSGVSTRQYPRVAERRRAVELQDNRCLYCEIPIGTAIWRRSQTVILRTNWDHFIPYAYLARNPSSNWVLACHVCNLIKSCRMFDTVQAAREAILPARAGKGYEDPRQVLLRVGLTPEENPWPENVRAKNNAMFHLAREIREGHYLTACGLEIAREDTRPIASHQRRCTSCLKKRDVPVVPPAAAT